METLYINKLISDKTTRLYNNVEQSLLSKYVESFSACLDGSLYERRVCAERGSSPSVTLQRGRGWKQ